MDRERDEGAEKDWRGGSTIENDTFRRDAGWECGSRRRDEGGGGGGGDDVAFGGESVMEGMNGIAGRVFFSGT